MIRPCCCAEVPSELAGQRLDRVLAALFPGVARSRLQRWIEDGHVRVNGESARKRDKPHGGDRIDVDVPVDRVVVDEAQAMALDIVYEDEAILVLNKPAGLVVHPGAGNPDRTLLNALLSHEPRLARLPRAGLVHRLDKDTSGIMVVAKTEGARQDLIRQLSDRTMGREYVAILRGVMTAGGTVNAPIGRDRANRQRMAVTARGRPAVSHYRVLKKYRAHTLVQVTLESGRTHQIRVHMAHLRFPVFGDPVYSRQAVPRGADAELVHALKNFRRQALHAVKLKLTHPLTGQEMYWSADVPVDMSRLMRLLARDAETSQH